MLEHALSLRSLRLRAVLDGAFDSPFLLLPESKTRQDLAWSRLNQSAQDRAMVTGRPLQDCEAEEVHDQALGALGYLGLTLVALGGSLLMALEGQAAAGFGLAAGITALVLPLVLNRGRP